MRRFSLSSFAAGAVCALALAAVPAHALIAAARPDADGNPSAYDATPPTLVVDPLHFQVGQSIDITSSEDICAVSAWHSKIPLALSWHATDAVSGVKSYDVITNLPSEFRNVLDTQATSQTEVGGNYYGECGGSDEDPPRWAVVAKDNRGNIAVSTYSAFDRVSVWQEDATAHPSGPVWGELSMTKSAGWAVSKCACYDDGTTLYSTAKGQAITYSVTTRGPGQTFAVVMEKNSNRGKASISVNGGKAATVDTYASPAQHAAIVWQATLPAGTSKVIVKNLGTASRSRIDVDALMLTGPPTGQVPISYPQD